MPFRQPRADGPCPGPPVTVGQRPWDSFEQSDPDPASLGVRWFGPIGLRTHGLLPAPCGSVFLPEYSEKGAMRKFSLGEGCEQSGESLLLQRNNSNIDACCLSGFPQICG